MTTQQAQLSYTSFDEVGSAGGWQVKQTTGGITPEESNLLVAGIHTALNPVEPLPPYPTPDQVRALPHRLAYRRIDEHRAAFWHTVPAGSDSTGRPGNVFAHVLLDRNPAGVTRPIELWRSSRWLAPYGAAAVSSAVLPDDAPGVGGVVTAGSVVEFVCGIGTWDTGTWRLGTLCGLLDAVAAALDGGPAVVLGAESVDTAAQWIGAVSFLMSPAAARRLNFSTFDRISDLEHSLRTGQHLIAVPRTELGAVPRDVLTIDEAEMLSMGEPGGQPHRTAGGHEIAVTNWSAMAQVALVDPASAARMLADIDGFSSRIGDAGFTPELPMAIAVLGDEEWADAVPEARMVIASGPPAALAADPAVAGIVDGEVQRLVGDTTADAWQAAEHYRGLVGDAARAVYLARAIRDEDWLGGSGLIPVPAQRFAPGAVPDTLTVEVVSVLDTADSRDPELLLRMVDLLLRAGVDEDLGPVIEQRIVPALLDPADGQPLVARLQGRVSAQARAAVAAGVLADAHGSEVLVLPQPLLGWLADGVLGPGAEELVSAGRGDPVWTRGALRGMTAIESRAPGPQDRFLALWWLRLHDIPMEQCEFAFGLGPWDPAELLLAAGAGPLPAGPAVITLLGAADSADVRLLGDRVLEDNVDHAAVACAAVRVFEPGEWITTGYLHSHFGAYAPYWDALIAQISQQGVHHDFAARLLVLAAAAVATGAAEPESCRALLTDQALTAEVAHRLEALAVSGVADADQLIAAALLAPETAAATAAVQPVLQQVAARLAATRDPADVEPVVDKMAQLAGAGSDGDVKRLRRTASKQLAEWQAEMAGGRPVRMWSR